VFHVDRRDAIERRFQFLLEILATDHIELPGLARPENHVKIEAPFHEGRETRFYSDSIWMRCHLAGWKFSRWV
jgi:hypothetical protein